jgi:hypothetical protein
VTYVTSSRSGATYDLISQGDLSQNYLTPTSDLFTLLHFKSGDLWNQTGP